MTEERKFEHHKRHQTPKAPAKPQHFVAENSKRSFRANGAETFLEFRYWRLVDHLYREANHSAAIGNEPVPVSLSDCVEVAFRGMPKPVDAAMWLKLSRFDINEQLVPVRLKLEISDSGAKLVELG